MNQWFEWEYPAEILYPEMDQDGAARSRPGIPVTLEVPDDHGAAPYRLKYHCPIEN
jgi:hypothetical protein